MLQKKMVLESEGVEILSLIGTRYAKILRPVSNMFLNMNEVGFTMNMLRDMLNGETPRRIKIETEFVP